MVWESIDLRFKGIGSHVILMIQGIKNLSARVQQLVTKHAHARETK